VVRADGEAVFEKEFVPGPGEGEWKKSVYSEKYKIYQNVYDREYVARIPRAAREVQIENAKGDWMTFTKLRFRPYPGAPGGEAVITPKRNKWGVKQGTYELDASGSIAGDRILYDREAHWKRQIEPWLAFQKKGVGVIVGEWGAYRYTPHPVALAWMEDCLKNWKKAGWGWALWNFRGSFGVLDSGRKDVAYEDFRGHKLDRKMLDLLRKY
jgi:hypothetical protein